LVSIHPDDDDRKIVIKGETLEQQIRRMRNQFLESREQADNKLTLKDLDDEYFGCGEKLEMLMRSVQSAEDLKAFSEQEIVRVRERMDEIQEQRRLLNQKNVNTRR
jgi:hypothetical protein